MVFIVLKTARYVDPKEVVKLGEILIFLGDDYIITVRHGEASELKDVRHALEEDPSCSRTGRARCCTRSSTRWSTTTGRRSIGLGEDIDEIENQVFSRRARQPARSASTSSSARCSSSATPSAPLVDPVERLSKGGTR